MRSIPELEPAAVAAAAATQYVIHLSPPTSSPTTTSRCEAHACSWQPYSNSRDFEENATIVLLLLLCFLVFALALNAAIRCFLRGGRSHPPPDSSPPQNEQQQHHQRKTSMQKDAVDDPLVAAPTVVFSVGMNLAGAEAECAICLSEFVEGEGIRVLVRCKHGFHAQCIEEWLSSRSSCPTCRSSCLPSPPSSREATDQPCQRNRIQQNLPTAAAATATLS
ncbi:hypothetical protein F2P56_020310 [Juglans regia]|uniref:RING-type E3 ubiquitin transferase n=2 Tax=Juglans regia TaxID=51240 RepID=A0A833U442_JUGRE|nr:RING-H2 finger protein ATL79-like [Juglans regia]KAF5460446.1 hypothetical protein F2P56_020310 [Juglans regia]